MSLMDKKPFFWQAQGVTQVFFLIKSVMIHMFSQAPLWLRASDAVGLCEIALVFVRN